jgi:AcrR family transcriptional regulator
MTTDPVLNRVPETGLGGRRKRRPQRYDEILVAAVTLFHTRGYHQSSLEEIAGAVGVTPTAIYRHFRNKQEILDTAALWVLQELRASFDELQLADSPEQQVQQLLEHVIGVMLTFPAFIGVMYDELNAVSPEILAQCMQLRNEYIVPWMQAVTALRPDLDSNGVRFRVHMLLAMVCDSTRFVPEGAFALREQLLAMCRGSLGLLPSA